VVRSPLMEFRILGSLEVWEGERQLELGGPKRRAVLAFLLLHANEVVAVDRLVDQLWGEKAPGNATGALNTHVSRLRKELGSEVIARHAWGYVLRCDPGALDLEWFERLSAAAESLPALERAGKLREALAIWRGPPLEDLAFEPGLAADIARLEELRVTVLENRIEADLEAGNQTGLVGELEALIAQYPLREGLRAALILALYRGGRQAEALEVYRETRRVLADELGREPSPELRDLERAILQQDPALRAIPVSAALSAEPGPEPSEQPVRRSRRRIFIGAALALLLAGLGAAAAYALSTRTTHAANQSVSTTLTTTDNHTGRQTETHGRDRTDTTHTRSTTTRSTQGDKTGTQAHPKQTNTATSTRSETQTQKTTTQRSTTGHGRREPIRISDDFNKPALNTSIWSSGSDGSGAGFELANGQLVFSIAGDATFDPTGTVDSSITTTCDFPFGFDARIHYTLPQWPSANGAALNLTSGVELIQRFTAASGDGYNALPFGGTVLQLPDTSGSLRLRRSQGFIRAYYLHDHQWTELGRTNFGGAIYLGLALGTSAHAWQGQAVSAAIDKFTVTAPVAECPPGDNPPK
jgi:DNA-binding SARP family transcriptional activator